jgi:hypothetical protein
VPEELRPAFAARTGVLHDVLFAESAATLQQVAAEPRQLGAELGFVGVLHSWGRQLQLHPHVHYIVPGGGLRGDSWIAARQSDWLLPVAKLAAVFRRRIDAALRERAPDLHAAVCDSVWRERWVVHCQPAGSGGSVVRYLARYVKRTAISDGRIVSLGDKSVTLRYRVNGSADAAGTDSATQQSKQCTLSSEEFLRRYLQHVPPPGQHRVRYFGWMHPAAKKRRMIVETLLQKPIVVTAPQPEPVKWHLRCPHCEHFTLVRIGRMEPRGLGARAPPLAA